MRLRQNQICPIHPSRFCCGREGVPREQRFHQIGIRRIDDPHHPRGYREIRSNAELRRSRAGNFTLRIQKNSQDSVRFTNETQVPMRYRTVAARIDGALWERVIENVPEELKRPLVASIQEAAPSNEAIKNAVQHQIAVTGAEVYRGDHLGVA